jgi:hypothetical protein
VVYFPDIHKAVAFRTLDEAITYRDGWRVERTRRKLSGKKTE